MTRITVRKLIWDNYNKEHIKKHDVTVQEVEIAIQNVIAHKKAKKGKYLVIGRAGSRILSVVIGRERTGAYYPVSARDAAKKERKIAYEKEKP